MAGSWWSATSGTQVPNRAVSKLIFASSKDAATGLFSEWAAKINQQLGFDLIHMSPEAWAVNPVQVDHLPWNMPLGLPEMLAGNHLTERT